MPPVRYRFLSARALIVTTFPQVSTKPSNRAAEEVAVVESVKAASEVYAPIGGEVIEVNAALVDAPEFVNQDAEGAGWFFKLKVNDTPAMENLMDAEAYRKHIEGLE